MRRTHAIQASSVATHRQRLIGPDRAAVSRCFNPQRGALCPLRPSPGQETTAIPIRAGITPFEVHTPVAIPRYLRAPSRPLDAPSNTAFTPPRCDCNMTAGDPTTTLLSHALRLREGLARACRCPVPQGLLRRGRGAPALLYASAPKVRASLGRAAGTGDAVNPNPGGLTTACRPSRPLPRLPGQETEKPFAIAIHGPAAGHLPQRPGDEDGIAACARLSARGLRAFMPD